MNSFNGNMPSTAKMLRVSRSYLYKWKNKEQIDLVKLKNLIRESKEEIKEVPRISE